MYVNKGIINYVQDFAMVLKSDSPLTENFISHICRLKETNTFDVLASFSQSIFLYLSLSNLFIGFDFNLFDTFNRFIKCASSKDINIKSIFKHINNKIVIRSRAFRILGGIACLRMRVCCCLFTFVPSVQSFTSFHT